MPPVPPSSCVSSYSFTILTGTFQCSHQLYLTHNSIRPILLIAVLELKSLLEGDVKETKSPDQCREWVFCPRGLTSDSASNQCDVSSLGSNSTCHVLRRTLQLNEFVLDQTDVHLADKSWNSVLHAIWVG